MNWLKERSGLLILSLCTIAATISGNASEMESVPGEFLVKLKPQYNLSAQEATQNLERLSNQLGVFVSEVVSLHPDSQWVLVKKATVELESYALKQLNENPMVDIAEPNFIYNTVRTPNDPMLGQLWGLINVGQKDSSGKDGLKGTDIGIEKAWDLQTGSKKVVVAVIDTGVDYTIEDLAGNVWINSAEANGKAGEDDDGNGIVDDIYGYNAINNSGDPKDDHGHGSHCSGTIGAKGDDGKGIVGVNWDVQIMGVKFLSASGSGSLANAIKGIDYATKMGANIMSNSWGGGGFSTALKEAIERASAKGILFVAAAGNSSSNNDTTPAYPASYEVPNVMSVAALDNQGAIASFSNYGKRSVHVAAPGVNVLSTTPAGYKSWSGTSMATPHVSGLAALLMAHDASLDAFAIRERIMKTAKPIASLRGKVSTNGLIDAYLALTNQVAPQDPNDPSHWNSVDIVVSSPHPYQSDMTQEWEVNVPGAKEFALYFSKFDTERGFDIVEFYDRAGNLIGNMSGSNDESHSPLLAGDYVKIKFKSDKSVNRYGFDISKANYR